MSFELQQNIKNNAQELRQYVSDLYEWEEEMEMKEKVKTKVKKQTQVYIQKQREAEKERKIKEMQQKNEQQRKKAAEKKKDLIRDKNTVSDYYKAWDKFQKIQVDKQMSRLEEEQTKPYRPYNPYEDSKNNVRAKPKTKMMVKGNRNIVKDPTSLKDKGNLHFKVCQYDRAIQYYTECLDKVKEEEETQSNRKLRAIVYSNRAMAYMKINERIKALDDCNESLKFDQKYVKTYLRRADCLKKLGRYKDSLADYYHIKKISSSQPEADIEIKKLEAFFQKRRKEARENMIVRNIPEAIPGGYRLEIDEVQQFEAEEEKVQKNEQATNYLEQL